MDENVVDTLKIEIVGDSGKAVDSIGKLISTLEKIKGATSGSNKGLNSIQKNLSKISEAVAKIDSGGASKLRDLADGLKGLNEVGNIRTGKTADRIVDLGAAVDLLKDVDFSKLTELADGLQALGTVGNVNVPRFDNSSAPADNATPSASAMDEQVFIPPSTVRETSGGLGEVSREVSDVTSRFKNLKEVATKAISKIGAVTQVFGRTLKRVNNFFKKLSARVTYRLINAAITAVTSSFKEGVGAIYQYSKALGGSLAKSLDSISTSFNYLKSSLGAMVAPLINALAPAIEWVVDKFVDLLNIANQVFARLSGATTWTKATKVATEYARATDAATAANKALKKSILGIDELNVLTDNSSDISGAGASNTSNFAFEEVPLDTSYVDSIIRKLKDILYYVGAVALGIKAWDFGKVLAKLAGLDGLKSFALAGGLMLTASGLTIMVKGMVDIISNGINIPNFVESLGGGGAVIAGGTLIGKAFGSAALGGAISAIVTGIPTYIMGIWDAIKEGLNWLNAALIGAGSTLTGAGIGAIIGMCGGPIGAGIGALIGLVVGGLTDLTILIVQNWDSITQWFNTNVIQPIASFFSGLWGGISSAASACWNGIVEFFSPAVEWFSNLFGSIYQTVSDIFYNIGVIATGCWEVIRKVWGTVSEWFGTNVIQPLAAFFTGLWDGFVKAAKSAWDSVKKVFSTVGSFFKNIFEKAWAGVVKVFSAAGEIFVDIKDAIVSAFKMVVNGIITGLNKVIALPFNGINKALSWIRDINIFGLTPFSDIKLISVPQIPLLAEGGMVNAGTAFIAGEAGAEVVGNIGNRTGVMNTDEMRESVARGVVDANAEQNALLREGVDILLRLLNERNNTVIQIGNRVINEAVVTQQKANGYVFAK